MDLPIFAELIRRGKLSDDWIQSGHKWYVYGKDHALDILALIVLMIGVIGWILIGW